MKGIYERSALLLGREGVGRLEKARVLVFGVGGVGGYAVEALARAGIGTLGLVDADTVAESNLNRQIIATCDTVGQGKAEAARRRILSINPDCRVAVYPLFYLPETADAVPLADYDYIVDAIDTMSAKIELITRAWALGIPVVSAMGCGNKLDPTAFSVKDLYDTTGDPVARVLRRELRKRGVTRLRVVCSSEPARTPVPLPDVAQQSAAPACSAAACPSAAVQNGEQAGMQTGAQPAAPSAEPAPALRPKRQTPGSVSYVPAVAGLILAGEVIRAVAGV